MSKMVADFLVEEEFDIKNSLAYAGLGLSKTTGQINEIITGIGFGGAPYSADRMRKMAEVLGEVMFHWHVLASTLEIPFDEIIAQYVASFQMTRSSTIGDRRITIQDMMDMKKYVKAGVLGIDVEHTLDQGLSNNIDIEMERKLDASAKLKTRNKLMENGF